MKGLIKSIDELKKVVEENRKENKKIVFTNGCFDILHAGHVDYLEKAKSLGDVLIVGLNSDSSIRRIKGSLRPIVPQEFRARVLLGLKAVDYVVIFEEDTPEKLIKLVRPDVLVKGADWELDKIVGREFAKEVVRIPFVYDISTTKIIEKILSLYHHNPEVK
jgi:rfaE bifunctional protein nucleotidyltransferase chain/domain